MVAPLVVRNSTSQSSPLRSMNPPLQFAGTDLHMANRKLSICRTEEVLRTRRQICLWGAPVEAIHLPARQGSGWCS